MIDTTKTANQKRREAAATCGSVEPPRALLGYACGCFQAPRGRQEVYRETLVTLGLYRRSLDSALSFSLVESRAGK